MDFFKDSFLHVKISNTKFALRCGALKSNKYTKNGGYEKSNVYTKREWTVMLKKSALKVLISEYRKQKEKDRVIYSHHREYYSSSYEIPYNDGSPQYFNHFEEDYYHET